MIRESLSRLRRASVIQNQDSRPRFSAWSRFPLVDSTRDIRQRNLVEDIQGHHSDRRSSPRLAMAFSIYLCKANRVDDGPVTRSALNRRESANRDASASWQTPVDTRDRVSDRASRRHAFPDQGTKSDIIVFMLHEHFPMAHRGISRWFLNETKGFLWNVMIASFKENGFDVH